jgi:hypothetical protein
MSGVLGFSIKKKLLGGAYFLAVVLSVTLCVCVRLRVCSILVNLFQRSSHLAAATIAAAATAAAARVLGLRVSSPSLLNFGFRVLYFRL